MMTIKQHMNVWSMEMKLRGLGISIAAAFLTACGGSSTSTPEVVVEPPPPAPQEVPEINYGRAIAGGLSKPGESAVSLYLKNGVYANLLGSVFQSVTDAAPPAAESSGGGFSTTNTQEQGVDEADRIEYNGSHLFVATQPVWSFDSVTPAGVRVLQRNDDFSLTEVNRLELTEENTNVSGMYLSNSHLSVVSSGYPMMGLAEISILPINTSDHIDLSIYDVSTPAEAEMASDIDIDGWLIGSRRIDDQIYLISAYRPTYEGLDKIPESDEEKIDSYNQIQASSTQDLIPKITINGNESPLFTAEECYIPERAEDDDGYAQLLSVTKIDVNNPEQFESLCIAAYADLTYMSTENLYLTAQLWPNTAIHKVSIGENLDYQASGEVTGQLGWRGNPQLRMSEADGYFRVVTSDYSEEEPVHSLSIFEQSGTALNEVAKLPNEQQPAAIGKPGEDIYAVRFIQDKAYVVTFERIDPLYVIDLADNTAPSVAGSLEIPGFSSYLHPMENGYLLGVGQDVTAPAGTGPMPVEPVTTNGMKVSLFDVSDPANPTELTSITRENTYTPVEYDYRALSVLKTGDQYQFAMPTETWGESDDGTGITIWSSHSRLMMMDVNAASGQGSLTITYELEAPSDPEVYIYSGEDRSVIHGEHVYYIHGDQVWHSLWRADSAVNGPY